MNAAVPVSPSYPGTNPVTEGTSLAPPGRIVMGNASALLMRKGIRSE
jgi:hypothetical protein